MKHGSLFSGIGGFDLAAQWMGWENIFHCEINEFCRQVLHKHFPQSIAYADIRTTDFAIWNGLIDILTGGFPCQPFSVAGKRKGTEDDRHLWPEMLRAIREIQPRWVVGENVHGIVNWSRGLVFEQVQTGLEAEGYKICPIILPACSVNNDQVRNRVWFVAYINKNTNRELVNGTTKNSFKEQGVGCSYGIEFHLGGNDESPIEWRSNEPGNVFKPAISRNINGLSGGMVDEINGSLGNAIVPQVVYQIFKAISQFETIDIP